MNDAIKELLNERVFFHFYQICQIPHGSGNEKELSTYIYKWAENLGLQAIQDEFSNVLIKKPASAGYETMPVVMLQAHLDMVCEKSENVTHDFSKDPIPWVVHDDVLSTGGKSTLGADDGIGVALAMAILEDQTLPHPSLEVLFTTMEEEDLSGAERFDASLLHAKYLINLDHVNEREIICGSCGGMQVDIRIPVRSKNIPEHWRAYHLSVSGLKGGHSGDDIHRGRGNANILLARALLSIECCCNFYLNQIRGGSFRLAIPRSAECYLWLDPANEPAVLHNLQKLEREIQAEHLETADKIHLHLTPAKIEAWGVVPDTVISAMLLVPDGIYQMNELFSGLVDTSDNLGEIYLDKQELHFVLEIRSAHESSRTYLYQKMERLSKVLGGSCTWCNSYPSWSPHPVSAFRQLCGEIYETKYNVKPYFHTVHAGLEVGYFLTKKPEMDAVSIGPDCWDFHSPGESLRISSVRKIYDYLCSILTAIYEIKK